MSKLDDLESGERYKKSQDIFLAPKLVAEVAFWGRCWELGGAVRIPFGGFGGRSAVSHISSNVRVQGIVIGGHLYG